MLKRNPGYESLTHTYKQLTAANKKQDANNQIKVWLHDVHQYMKVGSSNPITITRCPFCDTNLELEPIYDGNNQTH